MRFGLIFLVAIVSANAFAKEYVGIDICSKFDFHEFSDYLQKSHGISKIKNTSSGAQISYEFTPYKISDKEYTVKIRVSDGLIHEAEISPFLNDKSSLKSLLIRKYGYSGKRLVEKNFLGDHRYEISYLKLNDPDVRLYTDRIVAANGVVLQGESVTYECVKVSDRLMEQKKRKDADAAERRPKMTF